MSLVFSGSDPLASYAGSPFTGATGCVSVLAKRTSAGVTHLLCELSNGSTTDFMRLQIQSTNILRMVVQAASAGVQNADTAGTLAATTWGLCVGRMLNATTRAVALEGTLTTSGNISSRTPTLNTLRLGCATDLSLDYAGKLAHLAFWSAAPSDADLTALYNLQSSTGLVYANPSGILPASLVSYYPMTDPTSPGLDAIGGRNLTLGAGCTYSSDDPLVYLGQWARGANNVLGVRAA